MPHWRMFLFSRTSGILSSGKFLQPLGRAGGGGGCGGTGGLRPRDYADEIVVNVCCG